MKKINVFFSLVAGLFLFMVFPTRSQSAVQAQTPTFNREVVRIFQTNCQGCHHQGGIAPFPLMTYQDSLKKLKYIDASIQSGDMPPWKPEVGCGDFEGTRVMSDADKDTIHQWVMKGAPEGDPKDLPTQITFSNDWILGAPDVDLVSDKAYVVGAKDEDEYRCFILPFVSDKDQYITALETRPDKGSVVHHTIIYLDKNGDSLKLPKPGDTQPGYECFGGPGFNSGIMIGGWVPGNVPAFEREGLGYFVPKGSRLVLQVHYHADGKQESDLTHLGVHFAKAPVDHPISIGAAYDIKNLYIPAGEANYHIETEVELKQDVRITGVTPHMHLLGHKIGMEAILPDNTRQCLVQINDWDFHWQGTYRYKKFIDLPKGTKIHLTGEYNNTESNPDQPNHPPVDVKWGDRTVDEMFIGFFNFILQ